MFYTLFSRKPTPIEHVLDVTHTKLVAKTVEQKGVLVRTSAFEKVNIAENLAKYKASDFSLDNILAIGAYDMLKPVYITDMNNLNAADSVECNLNSMSNENKKA